MTTKAALQRRPSSEFVPASPRKASATVPFPTLPAPLARALADRQYDEPTPVQQAVIEASSDGRDLLVSAQTGSGKTVAFGIAIADTLLDGAETLEPVAAPLALAIAPTRELAL